MQTIGFIKWHFACICFWGGEQQTAEEERKEEAKTTCQTVGLELDTWSAKAGCEF